MGRAGSGCEELGCCRAGCRGLFCRDHVGSTGASTTSSNSAKPSKKNPASVMGQLSMCVWLLSELVCIKWGFGCVSEWWTSSRRV